MSLYKIFLVGIGGFLGSILRYLGSRSVDQWINSIFPFGTFTVNMVGSFLLGMAYGMCARSGGQDNVKLLLITGFCGGFTTFSAFAFENFNLIEQKMTGMMLIYMISSCLVGVLAVWGGISCSKLL